MDIDLKEIKEITLEAMLRKPLKPDDPLKILTTDAGYTTLFARVWVKTRNNAHD